MQHIKWQKKEKIIGLREDVRAEKLKIEDLYAERTYVIQEIKSPEGYKLNDNKIKIYTKVNDEGKLEVQKLEGETKEDIIIDENNSVKISVEDEPLSNLNIVKDTSRV